MVSGPKMLVPTDLQASPYSPHIDPLLRPRPNQMTKWTPVRPPTHKMRKKKIISSFPIVFDMSPYPPTTHFAPVSTLDLI